MCGVAGFIGADAGGDLLDRQLELIRRRGPDGEGRFVEGPVHLGMRRLSIIDLEHGWQPLCSRAGRVVAFQNGEIYNFAELRALLQARGYVFRTQSDTEVLAHGYDAWGMDGLLRRIDGMFAIVIADLDARVLHLARDRFGEKPLFFAWREGRFVYGSSLKSVMAAPWLRRTPDPVALDSYLATHFISGRRTIFKDVSKVLPGERLEVSFDAAAAPRLVRYYRPRLQRGRPATVEEIETLLVEAVESRLVADVPVGLFLSGGIDSSLIAALAARRHRDIEAFCVGFPGDALDESPHARAVADHLGLKLNVFDFDATKFRELMPRVCAALDGPIGDQALLPLFWLSEAASRRVKVVLSGEGADEVFGGYSYYEPACADDLGGDFKAALAAASGARGAAPGLLVDAATQTQSGFPLVVGREEREAIIADRAGRVDDFDRDLVRWLSTAHDPLQRAGSADLASWLPDDLLIKADRMTMAWSLEGRAPFLAPRLVERAMSLPPSQKYAGGTSKVILRELARRVLPPAIVDRRKHGFVLPMQAWLQEWFAAEGGFERYVASAEEIGLSPAALIELWKADPGQGRVRFYFALVVLIEWWEAFERSDGMLLRGET